MFSLGTRLRQVAVIAAHPDDEILAFGGTMHRLTECGTKVSVLILATGLAARTSAQDTVPDEGFEALRQSAIAANEVLGVSDVTFCDFPDNAMDSHPLLDVVKAIETFMAGKCCDAVLTHFIGDLNVDHQVVSRAVQTAARPLPSGSPGIFHGEVLSSSEYGFPELRFIPNTYVELGHSLEAKCEAMACYDQELRDFPHPRSLPAIRHLAALRGSEAGVTAAEALRTVRLTHRL